AQPGVVVADGDSVMREGVGLLRGARRGRKSGIVHAAHLCMCRKDRNMLMQTHEARLDALRKELARQGLDGFVIPISDEHLSEYVGAYAQRLAWLTGFGGSAGTAAVLREKAAIFVDGRYTLQVRDQVDGRLYEYKSVPRDSL